jgi:hypothetical protein
MPLTLRIRELFVALRDTHGENLNHSAIILQIEKMSQLFQPSMNDLVYPDPFLLS